MENFTNPYSKLFYFLFELNKNNEIFKSEKKFQKGSSIKKKQENFFKFFKIDTVYN